MSRLRVVSYAINGRGLGHLVRQLAILRQVRRIGALLDLTVECWVLTSSEADTLARREGFCSLKIPSKAMMRDAGTDPHRYLGVARSWVLQTLAGLSPDLLLVDTFPAGSFGELVASLECARRRVLVARRVRPEFADDPAYAAMLPLYHHVVTPDATGVGPILFREREELLDRDTARRTLGARGRTVYVTLGGGGDPVAGTTLPALVERLRAAGWHVVVGAGPLYLGPELRGDGITWLSRYAPVELFAGLDAAVSAGGYNTFHELMHAGVPTVFLPQPRIADDQDERAARAVAAGAGRVAGSVDEVVALLEAPGSPEAARGLVPGGGAKRAALAALQGLVPQDDLDLAQSALTPALSRLLSPGHERDTLGLVRLLAGGTATDQARRRALLADLADRGVDVPSEPAVADAGALVTRFFDASAAAGLDRETAALLVRGLARKFPAARPGELVAAVELLWPCWARFDDWMGALSLLRAVPSQRRLGIVRFAEGLVAWLHEEEDLFDAVRDFTRLEGAGRRPVSEVLLHLGRA